LALVGFEPGSSKLSTPQTNQWNKGSELIY